MEIKIEGRIMSVTVGGRNYGEIHFLGGRLPVLLPETFKDFGSILTANLYLGWGRKGLYLRLKDYVLKGEERNVVL